MSFNVCLKKHDSVSLRKAGFCKAPFSESPVPSPKGGQRRSAQELLIPAGLNLEIPMASGRRYTHPFLSFRGVQNTVSPSIILGWLLRYDNCNMVKNDLMIALVSTELPSFHSSLTSLRNRH